MSDLAKLTEIAGKARAWPFEEARRLIKRLDKLPDGAEKNYRVEDHAVRQFRAANGDDAPLPSYFTRATQISADAHLEMVAAVSPYIDSAISKTVNIPENYDYQAFKELYRHAWDSGVKALATYRPNAITGSVLVSDPSDPAAAEPLAA